MRTAFKKEANQPTIVDIDTVHDWAGFFAPAMGETNLERLAVSSDSGEAQRVYIFESSNGTVYLTYKQAMSSDEVYPRFVQVGSQIQSETHGAGQVVTCNFNKVSGLWVSEVLYHNGFKETRSDPPSGIDMYPTGVISVAAEGPRCETMQPDWPDKLKNTKQLIRTFKEKLAIFQGQITGLAEEWDGFFEAEEAKIAACTAAGVGGEFNPKPAAVLLSMGAAVPEATPPLVPPPAPPCLLLDPVVHSAYTSAARAGLQRAARFPPALTPGSLVLLRLKHGCSAPSTHRLPVCLGQLGDDFNCETVPDGALVRFSVMYCTASDLAGTWKVPLDESRIYASLPLRAILVSGLVLTAQRKLTQASVAKISLCIAPYDLFPDVSAQTQGAAAAAAE
jgi:hypothetical protein